MWSFSIFLEAVAILPQLFLLQRTGEAETITTHYLAALGAYRAFYIPNWIYRYVWRPLSRRCVVSDRFLTGGTWRTISTSLLFSLVLSKRGCTPISSTSTLPSEFLASVRRFKFLHRHKGCCEEKSSNYPREQISTQSNRWYKISYSYLVPSCEYLDAERISRMIC